MTFSYQDHMQHFAHLLGTALPHGVIEKEGFDLRVDHLFVSLLPGKLPGELIMEMPLGLLLHPIRQEKLRELSMSNFLGVNTGGCTLCLDEAGVTIFLKVVTSPSHLPEENWEWLHRLLIVSREWMKELATWEEFLPFTALPKVKEIIGAKKV